MVLFLVRIWDFGKARGMLDASARGGGKDEGLTFPSTALGEGAPMGSEGDASSCGDPVCCPAATEKLPSYLTAVRFC